MPRNLAATRRRGTADAAGAGKPPVEDERSLPAHLAPFASMTDG